MYEYGFITKSEVVRCVNYLLCNRADSQNEYICEFKKLHLKRKRPVHGLGGYDKLAVWESFFCHSENLIRILSIRRIEDIDRLLFHSWDYYDLDMPSQNARKEKKG